MPASPSEYRGPLLTVVSRLPRLRTLGVAESLRDAGVGRRGDEYPDIPGVSPRVSGRLRERKGHAAGGIVLQTWKMVLLARVMPLAIAPLGLRHAS